MSILSFFDPLQNRVLKVDDSTPKVENFARIMKGAPMGNQNAAGPHKSVTTADSRGYQHLDQLVDGKHSYPVGTHKDLLSAGTASKIHDVVSGKTEPSIKDPNAKLTTTDSRGYQSVEVLTSDGRHAYPAEVHSSLPQSVKDHVAALATSGAQLSGK